MTLRPAPIVRNDGRSRLIRDHGETDARRTRAGPSDSEAPLRRWFKVADKANWSDSSELKASGPNADRVGHLIGVEIGGDKYRLIIEVDARPVERPGSPADGG